MRVPGALSARGFSNSLCFSFLCVLRFLCAHYVRATGRKGSQELGSLHSLREKG
jgi:hypothetical protein